MPSHRYTSHEPGSGDVVRHGRGSNGKRAKERMLEMLGRKCTPLGLLVHVLPFPVLVHVHTYAEYHGTVSGTQSREAFTTAQPEFDFTTEPLQRSTRSFCKETWKEAWT